MKNFAIFIAIFAASFYVIQWLSSTLRTVEHDAVNQNTGSALQAAVTFGGVNILSLFIYFILAAIFTSIVFFTAKSKLKKH